MLLGRLRMAPSITSIPVKRSRQSRMQYMHAMARGRREIEMVAGRFLQRLRIHAEPADIAWTRSCRVRVMSLVWSPRARSQISSESFINCRQDLSCILFDHYWPYARRTTEEVGCPVRIFSHTPSDHHKAPKQYDTSKGAYAGSLCCIAA